MRSQLINRVTSGVVAALLLLTNVLLPASPAFASTHNQGGNEDHKYTICHRGDAVKNPYQSTPVDYHSIVKHSGHDDHDGPVATTQVVAQELKDNHQKWGDIIPAIPAEDGHAAYPGQNLTAEGLAILANDCEVPSGVVDMPQPPVVDPCNPLATPAVSNVAWGEYADTDEYHWTLESDGSLTATAEYGYHFELKNGDYVDSVNFTLPTDDGRLCDAEQVTVPTELVTDELCGKNNPNYLTDSLDAVEHVTYVVNADRSVTVTADTGYTLNVNGVVVGSTYTYVAPAEMLCNATSAEPEFVDNCGVLNDYYIVKDTDHVAYYNG
ncbi:MAG TPA: hypothetical protein VL362_02985, partial [Patescibacteria group bacterium]|nr:hypothetical protein [Patescibacteria group bacterium]